MRVCRPGPRSCVRTGASTGMSPSSRAAGWSARRSSSTSPSRRTRSPWPRLPLSSGAPPRHPPLVRGRPCARVTPSPARLLRAKGAPAQPGRPSVRPAAALGGAATLPSSAVMAGPHDSETAPDVIVIGGGIVGVSSAAHLAAVGRSVMLLERSEIAAGASGRNSGVVQHPLDPVLIGLHLETLALYRALAEIDRAGFTLPAE